MAENRTTKRSVQFNDRVETRNLYHWSFAHKSARCGKFWIQQACDDARFKMRIERCAIIINPVLEKKLLDVTHNLNI